MDAAEQVRVLAGRYRLDSVIGRGGMGTVWRARDQSLNRDVAVKEIVSATHLDEKEREAERRRATREAQTAARLSHPNVVGIYDILTEEGRPWIVMEFVPYPSLRDIVQEDGLLAPQEAAQVGLGILAALGAAHAEGILHRDVKPANVLVGPNGRVVLTDFGIARAADSTALTTSGAIVGSPPYISPERARGEQAGTPGDMWGLGATLYAAVEGRPPFERDTAISTLTAVVADDPEPASHAGPLWPVISELLRKDPRERLDADGARQMLTSVAHGEGSVLRAPVSPEPVSPAPAPPEPVSPEPSAPVSPEPAAPPQEHSPPQEHGGRRRSWPVVAIAVTAAVAAIGAAYGVGTLLAKPSSRHGTAAAASHPPARSAPSSPARQSAGVRSASPSASPSGSTTAGTAGYGALPPGFYRFTNSTGFSIGVPRGWQVSHAGHYVYINDPSNANIYLLIDQSDQPKPDPLADWEQQQANRAGSYPDYHLIRLASVGYPQAEKAADWEFTYDRDGVPVHILNRNVLANAQHAYALYWSTPASDWTADYHFFQAFAATFRPAP